jgi:fluoroacetyl-CoA thioesterase
MKHGGDDNPVACSLSIAELRVRLAKLLAQFKSRVTATEKLPDGYAFHLAEDKASIAAAAELIAAERECCRFLAFELTAEPNMGPVIVRVTGFSATKELLRTMFCALAAAVGDFVGPARFGRFSNMAKELPIGIRGEAEQTVKHEHTLNHHSSALPPIFSTPNMIGLMEWAAAKAMLPFCEEGEISVGTAINIEHRAPTTVGALVKTEAVLESSSGRFYVFRVIAHNGVEEIGRGTVTRTFVNPAKVAQRHGQGKA